MNIMSAKTISHKFIIILVPFILLANLFASGITKDNSRKGKPLMILTIGDSNGALPEGWVTQLRKLRANDTIFNISVSGNTIGFDNNGRRSLNTLANIVSYLDKAYTRLGKIDIILLMIGTNDCKAVFRDSSSLVAGNMRKILESIRSASKLHKGSPYVFIVSPPPYGPDELIGEKYAGGLARVTKLNEELAEVAAGKGAGFIDTFHILLPVFKSLSQDGVHLNADGQMIIARIIQENIKYHTK
jgi:lysophospholipase L1-like esterase